MKTSKNLSDMVKIDNKYYHPGVSLTLYDFAKKKKLKIINKKGFWQLNK